MKRILLTVVMACATAIMCFPENNIWLDLKGKNVSVDEAESRLASWFSLPEGTSFLKTGDETDITGRRHLRFEQYVDGVKVNNGIVKIHSTNGRITTVNANIMERSDSRPKNTASMANSDAAQKGLALELAEDNAGDYHLTYVMVSGKVKLFIDVATGDTIKSLPLRRHATVPAKGLSMYDGEVEFNTILRDGNYLLVDEERKITTINGLTAGDLNPYYVGLDAYGYSLYDYKSYFDEACTPCQNNTTYWTGKYIDSIVITTLTGVGEGDSLTISAKRNRTTHILKTFTPNDLPLSIPLADSLFERDAINTLTITSGDTGNDDATIVDTIRFKPGGDNAWQTGASSGRLVCCQLGSSQAASHWAISKAYDFYKKYFGWKGLDNRDTMIYIVVDPITLVNDLDNAFYEHREYGKSYPHIVVGNGAIDAHSLAKLDILAHEYTHGITTTIPCFEYKGESGALDESFADILGYLVSKEALGNEVNWLFGEGVLKNASYLRSFEAPETGYGPQPSTYKGQYWVDSSDLSERNDWGGVHSNSGVTNHWFYLLATAYGGITESNIKDFANVMFHSLYYLLPNSNLADARRATLAAISEYGGSTFTDTYIAEQCWDEVGVTSSLPSHIRELKADKANTGIYNMQGQRLGESVESLKPGVYVVDGRKRAVGM